MSDLKNIYEINLIDNDLNPFEAAVLELATMPKLNSLHLNLHEETQVDFVIRNLPNLKFLNGEEIDREELQNESSHNSDNQIDLEQASKKQSFDKINEVEEENESEHKSNHEEKKLQRQSMSEKASSFSNSNSGIIEWSDSEEIWLKPEDLEAVALIFDKIRSMHRKYKLSNDK